MRPRFVSKFKSSEIAQVYNSNKRNPSVSGSVPSDIRNIEAAGSDSVKKFRLSGPGTPFGMTWVKTRNEPAERNLCTCERHKHDPETCK